MPLNVCNGAYSILEHDSSDFYRYAIPFAIEAVGAGRRTDPAYRKDSQRRRDNRKNVDRVHYTRDILLTRTGFGDTSTLSMTIKKLPPIKNRKELESAFYKARARAKIIKEWRAKKRKEWMARSTLSRHQENHLRSI